jgi:exosortase
MNAQFGNQRGAASQAGALGIKDVAENTASLIGTHECLSVRHRSYLFLASIVLAGMFFWSPLRRILAFAATSGEFSYIPLIPVITAFLIAIRRLGIFADSQPSPAFGGLIAITGIVLPSAATLVPALSPAYGLSLQGLALVMTCWGLFILAYGTRSAQKALLPLGLLLFIVPPPQRATDQVIALLQHGSAALAYSLFNIIGVPAVRDGMTISLPHLTINVAPECSGIHSSISLLILSLAVANLYLRFAYNKILLVSVVVPMCILKNAIRIVSLSTLAIYVDPMFINGPIHHRGGILFFCLACAMLLPGVILLRRFEKRVIEHRAAV